MHKKNSTKFLVTISYKSIDFEFAQHFEPDDINIKWWRQFRTTDSLKIGESPIWNKTRVDDNGFSGGQAIYRFSCSPTLRVTLHKAKKDKESFERKVYRFAIESIRYDGRAKTLASTELDMSDYATALGDTQYLAIALEPKKKYVLKAVINLSVNYEFIRSGNSKDADMISTWSRESLEHLCNPEECDGNATFIGDGVWDLSVKSLARKIREYKGDLLVQGIEIQDFLKELSQCQLTVIIANSECSEGASEIVSSVNSFYSAVTSKFGNKIEVIYLSFGKQDDTQTIQVNCPRIKPYSGLHDVLIQDFDITTSPYLIVLSKDQLITCTSDPNSILSQINSKTCESIVEKWLTDAANNLHKHSTESLPIKQANKEFTLQTVHSLPNLELENKISNIRKKVLRRSSLFSGLQTVSEKTEPLTVIQAEYNIGGTLMKRGVSGITGRMWRPRQFKYQDGKIIYIDAKKNEVKGHIDLSEVISFDILPIDKQDKNNGTFNIVTRDRVFEMQAMDNEQMKSWIDAAVTLQKAITFNNQKD
ncbi:hypothetical protein LOD99_6929 [Oopsacas minuta]|uniref:PH domain-containing protein n=1 Tax=Oopsacas minuta TaxID=111878 RepID=A0AAV7JIZ4_9METZ|nr:hypothetical protein LOD99_6929 [Oopsacas minuta]